MSTDEVMLRYVYIPLAALMGAVSSLGASRWRGMSRGRLAFEIITHASFAMFITPWAAHKFVGVSFRDGQAIVGLTYLFAFAAPVLLPKLKQWLEKMIGAGEVQ